VREKGFGIPLEVEDSNFENETSFRLGEERE